MPRRRVLTDEQLGSLLALPREEADLVRHFTLSRADLDAIDRRRREHNRLGFALQLCAFRYPGRLLRPGETIPEEALRFVADQVGIGAPDAIAAYAARTQTRREQLDDLREAFGFAAFTVLTSTTNPNSGCSPVTTSARAEAACLFRSAASICWTLAGSVMVSRCTLV
jgi:TnpA family transposase